jgi:two-component system, OmpR family, sensor histidine kinase KdpD
MFDLLHRRQFWPIAVSITIVVIATVIIKAVDVAIEPEHLVFGYLIPTSFVAVRYGSVPAMVTSVAGSLCAAYFLYPPKFSIYMGSLLHLAELGFFLLLALATTQFIAVLSDGARSRKPTVPQKTSQP